MSDGSKGFSKIYWEKNYDTPEEMDGIGNASIHCQYLKNFFQIEYVDISSIIDFGMGLGHLFEECLKEFIPYKAIGIEPSKHAFDIVKKRDISPVGSTNLKLYKTDICSWLVKEASKKKSFDLGICTSVFQYMSEEEIDRVLPLLSKKIKYLYFSVPTDKELKRQVEEVDFYDEYAYRRSKSWYQKKIKEHFTFISSRILESKFHFDDTNTFFTDLLFRF